MFERIAGPPAGCWRWPRRPGARAGEWPQWRGPDGNSVSGETGLISTWSKAKGENLIWRVDWVGRSTPAVFDGRVCASGRADSRYETIACFDAKDGRKLWERRFPEHNTTIPFSRVGWASVSGDPETGYLYSQNGDGHLLCFDKDGKTVWEWRLGEEMGRSSGYGGRTHTPFIDEDRLIMSVVGTGWGDQAALRQRYVAFDKRSGKVLWQATPNTIPVEDFNNQSNAAVAVIGGQRLVIGGGADGWIYALKSRTGELVWKYHFSSKSLNSPPTVVGDTVYASRARSRSRATSWGRWWPSTAPAAATSPRPRASGTRRHRRGLRGPALQGRAALRGGQPRRHLRPRRQDRPPALQPQPRHHRARRLAGVGRREDPDHRGQRQRPHPAAAGGQVRAALPQPPDDAARAATWRSGAPSPWPTAASTSWRRTGCIASETRRRRSRARARGGRGPRAREEPAPAGAKASGAPARARGRGVRSGESVTFEVRAYDEKGRPVAAPPAASITWSLEGLTGTVSPDGRFQPDTSKGNQGGRVKAAAGGLEAAARVRAYAPLPWSFDFEGGKVPAEWVSAGRLAIADGEGGKTLHKAPVQTGLNRATVYIGPATLSGYTIEADLKATRKGRRMPDIGLINGGYTLDMQGNHQRLEVRSWASELAFSKKVEFAWEPDTWYRMKLRVEPAADKTVARGKVWKKSDPEPAEWTIVYEDAARIPAGAPGIYGDSSVDIDWDNLSVVVNR